MKKDFETPIYGGKFKFVPAELRYDVYQSTMAESFSVFCKQEE